MRVRPFTIDDTDRCLELFMSNVPKFFDEKDLEDFKYYLANHDGQQIVIEDPSGQILACGGTWVKGNTGRLSWGMVAKDHHGQGVGKLLTRERLKALSKLCDTVEIDTSQETEGFYKRLGFETYAVEKGVHGRGENGDGLDSVLMRLKFDSTSRK